MLARIWETNNNMKFKVLRWWAGMQNVIGGLLWVAAAVVAILGFNAEPTPSNYRLLGYLLIAGALVGAGLQFILLGQVIQVFLEIEHNTDIMAQNCMSKT
jgi:protein-S-isoprenylcysteine O-methyltransferase Ste14